MLFRSPEIGFQLLVQGVGSVVVSGISFTKMIQHFGPVRSTMMTALVPGLSALGAAYFLGEPLYWNLGAGLTLVTLGILFGVRVAKPQATTPIAPQLTPKLTAYRQPDKRALR